MKILVQLGLLVLSSLTSFKVIWAQSYTFTAVPGIGRPSGLNNAGQIVGYSVGGEQTHGFLYSDGVVVSITAPGSRNTFAYGINNAGQIVGAANGQATGTYGFVYVSNNFTPISVPGSRNTVARSINDNGQIVGTAIDGEGRQAGFFYTADTFETLSVPGSSSTSPYGINNINQ